MVDACAIVGDFLIRHVDPFGQHLAGTLNTVTEANNLSPCSPVYGPAIGCHRIDIVKQKCIWSDFIHVAADFFRDRVRTQSAKNSSWPQRIANGLIDTIFKRNLYIESMGSQAALLESRDDIVGISNRFTLIGCCRDVRPPPTLFNNRSMIFCQLQSLWINIHQGDGTVL